MLRTTAVLRPEHQRQDGDARLAILLTLLSADATSTAALLAAAGEGSRTDRLVALANELAGRIAALPPSSYVTKGQP